MTRFITTSIFLAALVLPSVPAADPGEKRGPIEVTCRARKAEGEKVVPVEYRRKIEPHQAAIVICDMWDDHWCKSAATRCDGLARKAEPVVTAARKAGLTIVHCPSDCMGYYKDHPARQRMQALKPVEPPRPKDLPNPPLPIDDSDGGCDDLKPVKSFKAWTKQHAAITIDLDRDYITDNGKELYSLLTEKQIKTVFVMGVHTNMCVLNRTFAIKQLRRWDVDCLLVRDLTDAMYNPKMRPFVTHDAGTNLVIEYIEQHWCPSVASGELLGKKE